MTLAFTFFNDFVFHQVSPLLLLAIKKRQRKEEKIRELEAKIAE